MQDPRATQILRDVTRLLEMKPLTDLKQCQAFVEQGTPVDSAFEPSSKSDTIARFYMRKAVLALITTHASDKVSEQWIKENNQKLDDQYNTMRSRAVKIHGPMEADVIVVGAPSAVLTIGFVLAGYGNSHLAKIFAALALLCLAYAGGILLFEQQQQKLPVEQRVQATSISILARNFLFPHSRLTQDYRLLDRLNKSVDTLLADVKKSHGKKLA